tara:strand:+ start:146 stop:484 length:339 start_codon:yes stop_codon:yes gene_type:complete
MSDKQLLKWATPARVVGSDGFGTTTVDVPEGTAPVRNLLHAIRKTGRGLPESSQLERAAYMLKVCKKHLLADKYNEFAVKLICDVLMGTVVRVNYYVDREGDGMLCDLNLRD